ncbi:hypothetical protein PMAYCL1PPCAC_27266, partial [Pristionchus mayeri]
LSRLFLSLLCLQTVICISDYTTCDSNPSLSCFYDADCGSGSTCSFGSGGFMGCCSNQNEGNADDRKCGKMIRTWCSSDAECSGPGKTGVCLVRFGSNGYIDGCCNVVPPASVTDYETCDGNQDLTCVVDADCIGGLAGGSCSFSPSGGNSGCCTAAPKGGITDYATCDNDFTRLCFVDADCFGGTCSYGPGGSTFSGCCTAKPPTGGIIDYSTCDNDASR